ncbi:MAG: transcriptional repressor LexA [Geminicoccaceae bacterium]|nr:transcriptional repressor LexA [Geminicoccaceae bacterium]
MLTQRQLQLLQFIHAYQTEKGVPPSFDEMRAALRLRSKSGIHRLISGLEERGYIRRLAYRARAIEILRPPLGLAEGEAAKGRLVRPNFRRPAAEAGPPLPRVPLLGRIAAGTPIEALADGTTTVEVPDLLLGEGEHYVVQVLGESMIDVGILDGDLAVIQRSEKAESGEIVVALIEDREVTLKRLRRRGASIALEPANPAFETRIFGPHQVKVQGRLVGLMRRY